MFGDGQDTPTRCELLSMVKKHSSLSNGKPTTSTTTTVAAAHAHADDDGNGDGDDASDDVEMDSNFWHDVLDLYFVRGTNSRKSQEEDSDDLIFFVRKLNLHGYGFNDHMGGGAPYFVRRWAPKLDKLVGESSGDVDWRRSFYLNLIAHTSFTVTVAICSHQVLQNHQTEKDTPLSPIYKVVKTVYASPSRVNFHLDSRKEVETTPAYPEICFAIDDFDSTFDAVVLTDTDHCYCVLLNAHEGAAFPSEKAPNKGSSGDISSLTVDTGHAKGKNNKLTLFSGFVSYQMVREAYDAGKSRFGSLLSLGQSIEKADRLYMKGPGGRGEVEVAVSGVTDQSQQPSGPYSPVHAPKKGSGFGTMILKAASVASVAAKQAYAAASRGSDEDNMLPLKCCLMSISLPWEHIAYDLLFKGSPQVNL